MDVGASRQKVRPVMNVTPLVDVVLVVLIIFMVITPLLAKQFTVSVPPKDEENLPPVDDTTPPLVMTVDAQGDIALNSEKLARDEVPTRVRRGLAAQREPVLFFDAADDAPVSAALDALDLARAGGAITIAALPDKLAR